MRPHSASPATFYTAQTDDANNTTTMASTVTFATFDTRELRLDDASFSERSTVRGDAEAAGAGGAKPQRSKMQISLIMMALCVCLAVRGLGPIADRCCSCRCFSRRSIS